MQRLGTSLPRNRRRLPSWRVCHFHCNQKRKINIFIRRGGQGTHRETVPSMLSFKTLRGSPRERSWVQKLGDHSRAAMVVRSGSTLALTKFSNVSSIVPSDTLNLRTDEHRSVSHRRYATMYKESGPFLVDVSYRALLSRGHCLVCGEFDCALEQRLSTRRLLARDPYESD